MFYVEDNFMKRFMKASALNMQDRVSIQNKSKIHRVSKCVEIQVLCFYTRKLESLTTTL